MKFPMVCTIFGLTLPAFGSMIVCFAREAEYGSKVASSIQYSLQLYRQQLTQYMNSVAGILQKLDDVDAVSSDFLDIHDEIRCHAARIPEYWELNEQLLQRLMSSTPLNCSVALQSTPFSSAVFSSRVLPRDVMDNVSKVSSYDSMEQVLVHLARDWSPIGEGLRRELYHNGIIKELLLALPLPCESATNRPPKVLIPGAGLGRVATELAAMGYDVEANECSGAMISALKTILEDVLAFNHTDDSLVFYPHLNREWNDAWSIEARFQPVELFSDDVLPVKEWIRRRKDGKDLNSSCGRHSERLILQLAPFPSTYQNTLYGGYFDAVVTCFFIDTAQDILEYIATLHFGLQMGGIWVNAGPLHYHRSETIRYSHKHLLDVIQAHGFELLSSRKLSLEEYAGEGVVSMKPESYIVPLTVFRKTLFSSDYGYPTSSGEITTVSASGKVSGRQVTAVVRSRYN